MGLESATPLACTRGCSYCCHVNVAIGAPEAFLLAEHLRSSLSSVELDALRAHLRTADDASLPIPRDEARMTAASAVSFAYRTAARDVGLDGRPVKLMSAVPRALDDLVWIDRWAAGEAIPDELVDHRAAREWMTSSLPPLETSVAYLRDRGLLW